MYEEVHTESDELDDPVMGDEEMGDDADESELDDEELDDEAPLLDPLDEEEAM